MWTLCFLHLHIEISVFHVIKLQNLYKTNLDINTNTNASQTKVFVVVWKSCKVVENVFKKQKEWLEATSMQG